VDELTRVKIFLGINVCISGVVGWRASGVVD
jgi:hypothetical protein